MTTIAGTKNTAAGWAAVRDERDTRLAACDWTVLPDAPMTADQRAAWTAYRQKLRDLTEAGHIAAVIWPKPPKA